MLRLLCLLTLVVACTPQTGVVHSSHAGLEGAYTRQIVISDHAHHVLMGHLIDGTQAGERQRMLVIGARRDGVHRLVMREVWSNGVELPFVPTNRRFDGCTHGHCRDRAVGLIVLSDALFAHAAQHGLSAVLIGSAHSVEINVPPALFSELPEYRVSLPE
ncbi:hypothetical protein [Gymnodinialimonas sp.]